jgi:hypothetical protein
VDGNQPPYADTVLVLLRHPVQCLALLRPMCRWLGSTLGPSAPATKQSSPSLASLTRQHLPSPVILSNIAVTHMTGFSLIADEPNTFSTSTQLVGDGSRAYTYAVPTPAVLTQAFCMTCRTRTPTLRGELTTMTRGAISREFSLTKNH